MNAVRLPLNILDYENQPGYLRAVGEIVRTANELELLAILAPGEPGVHLPSERMARFWRHCAAFFKDYPHVMFDLFPDSDPATVPGHVAGLHSASDWRFWLRGGVTTDGRTSVGMQALVDAVRAGGAGQPVIAMAWRDDELLEGLGPENFVANANVIYEASPLYRTTRTDQDRYRHFGFLAGRVPVLANGLDPRLDQDSEECASFPSDPSAAEALVQANLNYFDAHGISFTASVYQPGKLIGDYRYQFATSLDNGWVCGQPEPASPGIGKVIQAHLWDGELRDLFAVNAAGNFVLPRGGIAIAYGPIFAERDSRKGPSGLPTELGKVSVRVTDSSGVARLAGLLYVTAGWGQANFVVPPESAMGPAEIAVSRWDGTSDTTRATIADTVPGLWTGFGDGRGPALGYATQTLPGGRTSTFPIYQEVSHGCKAIPIPLSTKTSTRVRLLGTGFRFAGPAAEVRVKIGGFPVPVISFGSTNDPGVDHLTLQLPSRLGGLGETDLICSVNGRLSNVVRINLGRARE